MQKSELFSRVSSIGRKRKAEEEEKVKPRRVCSGSIICGKGRRARLADNGGLTSGSYLMLPGKVHQGVVINCVFDAEGSSACTEREGDHRVCVLNDDIRKEPKRIKCSLEFYRYRELENAVISCFSAHSGGYDAEGKIFQHYSF